jgi:Flp pilus assembly protein TadB
MNALMDEFTQEMTVVAEGLSEDLALAQRDLAQLSAAQTILEEGRAKDRRELSDRLDAIEKRLTALEKQREKGQKRGGLSQVLRQVTVIAAIIAGAWVLVTVLNLLGGS